MINSFLQKLDERRKCSKRILEDTILVNLLDKLV